ncbi:MULTISPECIES: oligoribonuclease [Legionella]|uniref:Oligoribonuclease n=1 Tax=Legionella drozanskii LLAP-1 TaxID=1212489 RepID=A0A0W0SVD0_9GAMM|nr:MULTISPECIES: oligoribonuclease [Legionella]KTC87343.1 oligoribonuclease [Legionella drozanskii LLAP-1]PJE08373.1 MAG: oligoribonuclease [Legionella sp.]
MKNINNLIWIDLEMTGLLPEKDRIIEMATIVTDAHLNILAEGPVFAIRQDEALLAGMDEWNTRQHNQSGLVKRVLESTVTEAQAERQTIEFLKNYIDQGKSPMCGNSICLDRRFLYKYMPDLAAYFHYRNLDVTTLKELVKRWRPRLLQGVIKESKHLALDDIKDSIAELAYYRQHFINLADANHD